MRATNAAKRGKLAHFSLTPPPPPPKLNFTSVGLQKAEEDEGGKRAIFFCSAAKMQPFDGTYSFHSGQFQKKGGK
jgi:hypothetical protein